MAFTDRDLRKLSNTKQASIEFNGKPSLHGMLDGQVAIEKKSTANWLYTERSTASCGKRTCLQTVINTWTKN